MNMPKSNQPGVLLEGGISLADNTQQKHVLVVADDSELKRGSHQALTKAGYKVIEAYSADAATSLAQLYQPDIVLLDSKLESADSFAICCELQNFTLMQHASILVLTEPDDEDSIDLAFQSGASGFVTKPVNFPILMQQINYHIRTNSQTQVLFENQRQLDYAQRIAGIGHWHWDANKEIFSLSTSLLSMLGLDTNESIYSFDEYLKQIHEDDHHHIKNSIADILEGAPKTTPIDYRMFTKDKTALIVHQELSCVQGKVNTVMGTVQNITKQRATEQHIRQLAYSDQLTGLASRASLYQYMEDTITVAKKRKVQFALLYIDLDCFKDVNDSLGHDAGDELLKIIASRLTNLLREDDFVARLSGDEFCILTKHVEDKNTAADIAKRCLYEVNQPILLESTEIRSRCSIGIVHFPEDGDDLQTLLKAADSAMYDSKDNGRHRYTFFRKELTAQAEKRLQLEQDLRLAIARDQLELHYQPQIDLKTGKMMGVEALVRWRHPKLGVIPPLDFISVAERMGLIIELGDWVLQKACRQAVQWQKQGVPELRMAVNISPLHFNEKILLETVVKVLYQTGLAADLLELEITESVAQTANTSFEMFDKLRAIGIKVAIDDFGTGYSSLSSLKLLPLDTLKIDRLFITDIIEDRDSTILLGTIVGLAHALGHKVIAEGVEDYDQLKVLAGISCDYVQGYLFSQPVLADKIPELAIKNYMPK